MAGKHKVFHSIHHFLIGVVLTLKGADKIAHHPVIGSIILLFGIIILFYFFYSIFKNYPGEKLSTIIHWFEAISCLFTAYVFYTEGSKYLHYVFLLAAVGFFMSIFVSHRKKEG